MALAALCYRIARITSGDGHGCLNYGAKTAYSPLESGNIIIKIHPGSGNATPSRHPDHW